MADEPLADIQKLASSATQYLEECLINMFGNLEKAKEYAQFYVLEEKGASFWTDYDVDGMTHGIRMETEYRLRLKTQAELDAQA